MKLSMWMIANRLEALEPELQIKETACAVFRSARKAYATNCVHVFQEGKDVVCIGEDDSIRLKNIEEKQAFEIIQGVFDFYNNWNEELLQALQERNGDRVIEQLGQVFQNPIVLMDDNYKVLAMSDYCMEGEPDEEWKHLCQFGYSSVNSLNYLRQFGDYPHAVDINEPKMYRFPRTAVMRDSMYLPVFYNGVLYGKLVVLEDNRRLNAGDVALMKYVVSMLGPFLERNTHDEEKPNGHSVFLSLIQGQPADEESLERQMAYLNWDREHPFRVVVFEFRESQDKEELLYMVLGLLKKNLGRTAVFIYESRIILIMDEQTLPRERAVPIITAIVQNNGLRAGESFAASGLKGLSVLYDQSLEALHFGRRTNPDGELFRYYDFAVDHVLKEAGIGTWGGIKIFYACHPDVLRLWKLDKKSNGSRIETLWAYLNNDRSLLNTAQELYVHRSTLVYRIKKITDELTCDLTDSYTRDYMKISIRFLRIYDDWPEEIEKGETRI